MSQGLSGPGLGLPYPQNLYPSYLPNAPIDVPNNEVTLSPGDAMVIPAGVFYVTLGLYSVLQYNDPVLGTWRTFKTSANAMGQPIYVKSDGFTYRVANLTGCPVAGIVIAGGSNYVAGSTTITPTTGNSTWQAIVGGLVTFTSMATVNSVVGGAGYSVPPLVLIDAPPSPGFAATARAVIANGTVSSVVMVNQGAGYVRVPNAVIVPQPTDPNANSITQASVVLGLAGSGQVTGAICTNPGTPQATVTSIALTVAGVGTAASVNAVMLRTIIAAAGVTGAAYADGTKLLTSGGTPTGTPANTNPDHELTGFVSREPRITMAITTGNPVSIATATDGGLFAGAPVAIPVSPSVVTTQATVTLTMGSAPDTIAIQPAP